MTDPTPTTAAVQSLAATGWCPPTGHDMRYAAGVVAPSRWRHRRTGTESLAALRDWVWSSSADIVECSRAQAARVACSHAGIGTACLTCAGSGIDPTGRPDPAPYQTDSGGVPIRQPRCRVCAGIGLLSAPTTAESAVTR